MGVPVLVTDAMIGHTLYEEWRRGAESRGGGCYGNELQAFERAKIHERGRPTTTASPGQAPNPGLAAPTTTAYPGQAPNPGLAAPVLSAACTALPPLPAPAGRGWTRTRSACVRAANESRCVGRSERGGAAVLAVL